MGVQFWRPDCVVDEGDIDAPLQQRFQGQFADAAKAVQGINSHVISFSQAL